MPALFTVPSEDQMMLNSKAYYMRKIAKIKTLQVNRNRSPWKNMNKLDTCASVTLKTRFQGKRKEDASPNTRVETYINF